MKKKIFSNLGLKLMAMVVAFLIWLMVVNGDDPIRTETFRNVPITVKNADVFMEKVKKVYKPREDSRTGQEIDRVTVFVRARRSVIDKLSTESFTVTADFENIVENLNTIPLEITCSTVPSLTMKDMWCDLRSLKVELEDVKDATFVLSVKEEGTPASGYQVGNMEVADGESIAIAGPESDMKKIGKVVVNVDVNGLRKNHTVTAPITIIDKNEEEFKESQMERLTIKTLDGKVFEQDKVDVNVEIWKVKSGIIPDVEVSGEPSYGYRIAKIITAPETISLAGGRATLQELGNRLAITGQISVDGAAETFSEEINLREYLEKHYGDSLKLERDLSDIIVVTVQMEKIGTTAVRIPVSDIIVKGRMENMSYKLTPADNILLEIQPKSEGITTITADEIQVTLDLSESEYQEPGNYQIPLDVLLPEGYTLTSQAVIAVNVTRIEPVTESEGLLQPD